MTISGRARCSVSNSTLTVVVFPLLVCPARTIAPESRLLASASIRACAGVIFRSSIELNPLVSDMANNRSEERRVGKEWRMLRGAEKWKEEEVKNKGRG